MRRLDRGEFVILDDIEALIGTCSILIDYTSIPEIYGMNLLGKLRGFLDTEQCLKVMLKILYFCSCALLLLLTIHFFRMLDYFTIFHEVRVYHMWSGGNMHADVVASEGTQLASKVV